MFTLRFRLPPHSGRRAPSWKRRGIAGRAARYSRNHARLVREMRELGFLAYRVRLSERGRCDLARKFSHDACFRIAPIGRLDDQDIVELPAAIEAVAALPVERRELTTATATREKQMQGGRFRTFAVPIADVAFFLGQPDHRPMKTAKPDISRRAFLGASALAAPAILKGASRKRNVLFIASDDLCNRIGCYGAPLVRTPNIDRMARSGVRFDRSYCQYPLCSPSRTSLMTGLAPDTARIWANNVHFRTTIPDVMTLPQAFHKNGYFTARAGKIYHYNNPSEIGTPGLDDPSSWMETANPAGYDRTHDEGLVTFLAPRVPAPTAAPLATAVPGAVPWARGGRGPSGVRIAQDGRTPILPLSQNGDLGIALAEHASDAPDESITDFMVAESVIAMMDEHRNEPWFLAAGFYRPHVPFIVPSKYFDLYSAAEIQVPPFEPSELTIAPRVAYMSMNANYGMSQEQHREAIRAYYAAISFVDAQVGRLLDALRRMDLDGDTTIVFWADHGWMLGEHGQWQKTMVFEPSARVPLIVAGAGVGAAGRGCGRTVEHLDIYPTLVELCDLEGPPSNLQGISLAPLLANPDAPRVRPAISQVSRRTSGGEPLMGYSIRTERYRYTTWGPEGEELYDYDNDPRELRNLAADAGSAGVKAKLHASLQQISRVRGSANAPGAFL